MFQDIFSCCFPTSHLAPHEQVVHPDVRGGTGVTSHDDCSSDDGLERCENARFTEEEQRRGEGLPWPPNAGNEVSETPKALPPSMSLTEIGSPEKQLNQKRSPSLQPQPPLTGLSKIKEGKLEEGPVSVRTLQEKFEQPAISSPKKQLDPKRSLSPRPTGPFEKINLEPLTGLSKLKEGKFEEGPISVRELQEKFEHPAAASSSQAQSKEFYSTNHLGLRTRVPSVDDIDAPTKKELLGALNFISEVSDKDLRTSPDIPKKEKAALLYLFLKCVQFDVEKKQNIVATVVAHVIDNAEGGKKSTPEVEAAAKKLKFMANAYYKPVLERLLNPKSQNTAEQAADEMHSTAKVLFGEKPPNLKERMSPFLVDILKKWDWEKCKEWQTNNLSDYKLNLRKLVAAFTSCRKEGNKFEEIVLDIEKKVSK